MKILKSTKQNELEHGWKGLSEVIDYLGNNNRRIRNKDKILRVHIYEYMPYFSDVIEKPDDIDDNFEN